MASYENVIFSCLSQQPPGTLTSGKKRGMKCCRTRWCLIKELIITKPIRSNSGLPRAGCASATLPYIKDIL